jgi:hypothetical protein
MASNNRNTTNSDTTVDDRVLLGVLDILDRNVFWRGTMTDLNSELSRKYRRSHRLPGSPSALRVVLNRVVARLRSRKISVQFGRATDYIRTRYVRFEARY